MRPLDNYSPGKNNNRWLWIVILLRNKLYFHDDCHGGNHPLSFYFLRALIDFEHTVSNLKQSARTRTTQIIKNVLIGSATSETRHTTVNIYFRDILWTLVKTWQGLTVNIINWLCCTHHLMPGCSCCRPLHGRWMGLITKDALQDKKKFVASPKSPVPAQP